MAAKWQTVRVFISSTFRDMHAERDYLVQRVFPALRERLEKYRIHLIDIDLRWGITEEQSDNDQALGLCLQQIDECRPFFIGLLGERYGFVPKQIPDKAISRYGWIQHETGKSITELEILHGILNKPEMHGHAFFYFRDPSFIKDVPETKRGDMEAEDGESAEKLNKLKDAIRKTNLPEPPVENYPCQYAGLRINRRLVHHSISEADQPIMADILHDGIVDPDEYNQLPYHLRELVNQHGTVNLQGLTSFGEQVHEHLWVAIQKELNLPGTPPNEDLVKTDPMAEEQDYHDRFIESRTRIYIGRESIQKQLWGYIESNETHPCLVNGPSGLGKSAALAKFVVSYQHQVQQHNKDTLIISHFIGASPNSTNLRYMLRRFCTVLQDRFDFKETIEQEGMEPKIISAQIKEDINELANQFREFLDKIPEQITVLFVIDALNQLDELDNAHALYWLPTALPEQVKLIASCIMDTEKEDQVLASFQHRPHATIHIEPLTDEERKKIIYEVPSLSAKVLDQGQVDLLLKNQATKNPLFLLVALEELRGFGSFEQLNQHIEEFPIEGNTIAKLFIQVIERLEEEFDTDDIKNILSLLAVSRSGLSQLELFEIIEGIDTTITESKSDLLPILRQLRPYLQVRGEFIDFYHRNLYKAVYKHYLKDVITARKYHKQLADYFYNKLNPYGFEPWANLYSQGLSELPYHLVKSEAWTQIENVLCDLQFIEAKCSVGMTFSLVADYYNVLDVHPGAKKGKKIRLKHEKAIEKYIQELIAYAKGEIKQLSVFPSVKLCSNKRIKKITRWMINMLDRMINERTKLDSIYAFLQFVNAESHGLIKHGSFQGYCLQQAYNSGMVVPVVSAAERIVKTVTNNILLLHHHTQLSYSRLEHALQKTLEGHRGDITCVKLALDGKRAVSGDENGILRVWDIETGVCLQVRNGNTSAVVEIFPEGNRVVSKNRDQELSVWDLDTGVCYQEISVDGISVERLNITSDGKRLVTSDSEKELRVWDLETGSCIRTINVSFGFTCHIHSVSIDAKGKRALVASNDGLRVWDIDKGICLQVLEGNTPEVEVMINKVNHERYDVVDYLLRRFKTDEFDDECLSMTPDGKLAVSGSRDSTLRVWDLNTGTCLKVLEGHDGAVECVSVTPDGKLAVSGSSDETLRVWDLNTGACLKVLEGHDGAVECVSMTPDGKLAVSGSSDETLRVWDLKVCDDSRSIEQHESQVLCVNITPDGKQAITGSTDATLRVWDLNSGACLQILKGHTKPVIESRLMPVEQRVVSTSTNELRVWDLDSGICLRIPRGDNYFQCIWVMQDGKGVISGHSYQVLHVWDLNTGACLKVLEGHEGYVTCVSVTPDGKLAVSGGSDETLRVWDLHTGSCLNTFMGVRRVFKVRVMPDGKSVISSSADGMIRVWDLNTGVCKQTFAGSTDWVGDISITPDGKHIVSGSSDKTLRVWCLETRECIAIYQAESEITSVSEIRANGDFGFGTRRGEFIFLTPSNFTVMMPIITPVISFLSNSGNWEDCIKATCSWCGQRFPVDDNLIDIINSINQSAGITPGLSPCLELADEAWDEPRLVSECPNCLKPLKFNPFIVDNRDRY